MKTTLVLIIAAVAGMSFAGPSDSAAFAIRAAKDASSRSDGANRIALMRGAESQCSCGAQAVSKTPQTYVSRGQLAR